MAKYVVSVERTRVEATTIYVEAKNADLAAQMVEKDAEALNSGDDSNTNLFFGAGWDLESESIEITEDPYTEESRTMTSPFNPSTDLRVQEALSRKYSNDVVILLSLRGEQIAVFNSARELCGFVQLHQEDIDEFNVWWNEVESTWHPPTAIEPAPTPKATLDDLELL